MAEEAADKRKSPTSEKFRAHGVQNDWLNEAKGKSVEIILANGQVLNGRLVGYDIYCLALDEASQRGNTLIYKQSIVCARFSKE
jgi:sRNA-binding regulator protein Hfq